MTNTHAATIRAFILGRHPRAELTDEQDIFSLGFINSLFAMELVMFIEKQFAVSLPNNELRIDNFRTVSSMAELVERRLSAASAA
ncbi:acyl carrier protein [Streptomyces sp. NBC_01244]|uniref:acyl carrier protein n=1 Tax=Streptomyces sp. NBC_01244 TaxID=2903797 RepID=UPI002E0E2ADB|nr:acyl carrier protein [Streptomyces sp. NBC_01244]